MKSNMKQLDTLELKNIEGGSLYGAAGALAGLGALALACIYYIGYDDGKNDCPPFPECIEID